MPDVRQMTWKTSGHDEDCIDAHVVTRPQVARSEPLGREHHTTKPPCVERESSGLVRRSSFHFYEGKDPAAARNDVDLTAGHPRPPDEDPPAMQPQPKGCECFG